MLHYFGKCQPTLKINQLMWKIMYATLETSIQLSSGLGQNRGPQLHGCL